MKETKNGSIISNLDTLLTISRVCMNLGLEFLKKRFLLSLNEPFMTEEKYLF